MPRDPTLSFSAQRAARLDWKGIRADLDERGYARVPSLLSAAECRALRRLYADEQHFRKTIDLERHRFGRGEYKYFAYPLPPLVAQLRTQLYPRLAAIANDWMKALGVRRRYPTSLARFLAHCRQRGQARPTPLMLDYTEDCYNCLHQDLYGDVAFPLQLTCLLSRPGRDFAGGEFLLVEQRPRMQSRGEAIALREGEAVIFPNRERPVRGARGCYRTQLRHGVSRIERGRRSTLGIIFHDAR
ncbi:MAG: 2OG-Fe(II) oxygenase [Myxococcota bacterium]